MTTAKATRIVESLNVTNPTARRTMTELKATGLVNMHDSGDNSEEEITLSEDFDWFLSDRFAELRGLKRTAPHVHTIQSFF